MSITRRFGLAFFAIIGAISIVLWSLHGRVVQTSLRASLDEHLRSEFVEFSTCCERRGVDALRELMELEILAEGREHVCVCLRDEAGRALLHSDPKRWKGGKPEGDWPAPAFDRQVLVDVHNSALNRTFRMLRGALSGGRILEIAVDEEEIVRTASQFVRQSLLGWAFLALVASIVAWLFLREAMGDVRRVTGVAARLGHAGHLDERVPEQGLGSETRELAETFNGMLVRIAHLFKGMTEVTDAVAHDLRAPLTRIRTAAETSLLSGESSDREEALQLAVEECDRLVEMIRTFLDIAKTEAGSQAEEGERIELGELLRFAAELFEPLADARGLRFELGLPAEALHVWGSRDRLQRVVANLLDNAIKFGGAGERIWIGLAKRDGRAIITVRDEGEGIPPEDRPHVFRRFFRGEPSRSTPGSGLGLAFVRAVVTNMGGIVELAEGDGPGAVFVVSLPLLGEEGGGRAQRVDSSPS